MKSDLIARHWKALDEALDAPRPDWETVIRHLKGLLRAVGRDIAAQGGDGVQSR